MEKNTKNASNAVQSQISSIGKLLTQQTLTLKELDDLLPVLLHVYHPEALQPVYVSENGCEEWQIDKEALRPSHLRSEAFPADSQAIQTQAFLVKSFEDQGNAKVYAAFQQVRRQGEEGYLWVYTTTRVHQKLQAPISVSIPVPQMGPIARQMTTLQEENQFLRAHYQRFASLTKREREVLQRVIRGEKRRHIADALHISLHTYDTHRKNIREKLGVKSLPELMRYARIFGMTE
ncbi:MAG: LuxR family transcriptional regulator [Bacteroidetes bacterium]|nr:MAG: LuxR family transcriptional regulator [Bacteroidota bacterium]